MTDIICIPDSSHHDHRFMECPSLAEVRAKLFEEAVAAWRNVKTGMSPYDEAEAVGQSMAAIQAYGIAIGEEHALEVVTSMVQTEAERRGWPDPS